MKRPSFAAICNLLVLYISVSCTQLNRHSINISISESGHYYKILAQYNSNRSTEVDRYINKHFGKISNMSFRNTQIDGNIAMDDGTKFYMKKEPGYLEIKFNKNENSLTSYKEVKALGDDIKYAVQQ